MARNSSTDPAATEATDTPSVTIATGFAARARRRKIALLVLLIAILALLVYSILYFEANRRLPLPKVGEVKTFEAPQYLYSISGTGADAMTQPIGIAVSRNGRVYEVDMGTRSIRVYQTSGAFLFTFNAIDDGTNKTLKIPVRIAVDANGDVYVTDRMLHGVYVFGPDGTYKRKLAPNNDATFPWLPLAIYVDEAGGVYVSDIPGVTVHRIIVLDNKGTLTSMFGKAGLVTDAADQPGVLSFPNGLVAGPGTGKDRELYIADSNNRRIQVFSVSGSFRRMIRTEGNPRGIALDSNKRLYAANVLSHQVDVFSTTGEHLGSFGEMGVGPGQFRYPEDVSLDARGRIYVSDRENNQIQVWGYPVLEIPGVTKIEPSRWPLCLIPLPLLLLPLLLRRRRFLATDDFVEGMVTAELVKDMVGPRWRWIVPEAAHPAYIGRVVDGIDLGELLEPQPYSHSDATALSERLGIALDQAAILTMAKRYKILCTEDGELARLAVLLGVDAYDRTSFVAKFVRRERS